MQIEESFEVTQSVDRVWRFFEDVSEVASCMPGAELLEHLDDGSYRGKLTVKVGPITSEFDGRARLVSVDHLARKGVIEGKGVDQRGASTGSGTLTYMVMESASGTRVEMLADYQVQGRIAQFGRMGVMRDVASNLTRRFAECVEQKLAAATEEETATIQAGDFQGIRVLLRSLWSWLQRLIGRS